MCPGPEAADAARATLARRYRAGFGPASDDGGIEVTLLRSVPDAVWAGLATEAEALVSLLACREPEAYRRY